MSGASTERAVGSSPPGPPGLTALSPPDAWQQIAAHAAALPAEQVLIAEAAGRRLAEPVIAAVALPRETNSAMDGFGVRAADGPHHGAPIVGESRAGVPFDGELPAGGVIRIATGATAPPGVDSVVRVEDSVVTGGVVELPQVALGTSLRVAGEDLAVGDVLAAAGTLLAPHHLVALAAAGVASVTAHRRPRVSFVITGDELVAPGEPVAPGQVTDVHGIALPALVRAAGGLVGEILHAPDRRSEVDRVLAGLKPCEVVVVTGGLSVGQHDHTRPALAALGVRLIVERLLMRPGQPTAVGVSDAGQRLWFGLPGNPVSAFAVAALLLVPALRALGGAPSPSPGRADPGEPSPFGGRPGRLSTAVPADPRRWLALRAVRRGAEVEVLQGQGSHMVAALAAANALVLLPPTTEPLPAGAIVDVLDLDLLISPGAPA
jgi:molybdopterin molybdotransferase